MAEDGERQPQTYHGKLNQLYGDLLDINREIIQSSRQRANDILELKEFYLDQASRCDEIAEVHIRAAQHVSSTFGDILSNEWGVEEDVDDDGEDEGEEGGEEESEG